MNNPLVGMWRLIRIKREGTVEASDPPPTGCLVYTEQGWMTESLLIPTPGEASPTRTVIYCGTYAVEGDQVIHRPAFHLDATQIGQDLPRRFEYAEDGSAFTLISGPLRLDWERIN